MTAGRTPSDGRLASLLTGIELLMVDFDGPICRLFAGFPPSRVAEELRCVLSGLGAGLPAELASENDPHRIYRRSAALGREVIARVHRALSDAEVRAAATARPTPAAVDVLWAARRTGLRTAVVSNNAAAAVESYLARHGLDDLVDHVAARRTAAPEAMKPAPDLVLEASRATGVDVARCVIVGDSPADVEAARAAGVVAVGFANRPGKATVLADAGAAAVITSMGALASAIGTRPSTAGGGGLSG